MKFEFLEDLGIIANLNVLKKSTTPYKLLLYQHQGNLTATNHFIGNRENVDARLSSFFGKAIETNSDLVLTPEYCCSWQVLYSIISDSNKWPGAEKLWIIGGESITIEELFKLKEQHTNSPINIHFEEDIANRNGNFVDPLIYLFKGKHKGADKLIMLIQFKTAHMGARAIPIERNNLIEGSTIYVIRNSANSIHLFSLICSEAMIFQNAFSNDIKEYLRWDDIPFLVFNPQMNPSPTHADFRNFRKFVIETERKEVISLNWQYDSTAMNSKLLNEGSSRSTILLRSTDYEQIIKHIKPNHEKGLYYFNAKANRHLFVFNSSPHCFQLQITPVYISERGLPQRLNDGPFNVRAFFFNENNELHENDTNISDHHLDYLQEIGCTSDFLNNPENCIIGKEILVALSTGVSKKSIPAWHNVQNIYPFQSSVESDENFRITFTEDSSGINILKRNGYITAIQELDLFLNSANKFPSSIAHLKGKSLRIGFSQNASKEEFLFNVIDVDGQTIFATLCHLGLTTTAIAQETFDNLQNLFSHRDKSRDQVVVLYKKGNDLMYQAEKEAGKITSVAIYENQSIFKENR